MCLECGKCCHSNYALTVHSRNHSRKKPTKDSLSSKQLTTSSDVVVHGKLHGGEKQYECSMCDKVFSMPARLKYHMRVHTGGKPLSSSQPNESPSQVNDLQQQQSDVECNTAQHHCPNCKKLFKTKSLLKCHLCIHTSRKPYYCKQCSDCFTFPGQLRQHLLTSHNEGSSLICHICQKTFSHSRNFVVR